MSNISVAQILMDAQRMAGSVKDLDTLSSSLLVEADNNNCLIESLQRFQDDIDSLNHITNNKSNTDMINRIQLQNANSSEILKENRELKVCIEDYERAMELIMQKYRDHASNKVLGNKLNLKALYNEKLWLVIREQREKINEMATVMHHAASIDDSTAHRELEIMSNLRMENKTLRELLQISKKFGSNSRPICLKELQTAEKSIQTEVDDSVDTYSISAPSSKYININSVIHFNSNQITSTGTVDKNAEYSDINRKDNNIDTEGRSETSNLNKVGVLQESVIISMDLGKQSEIDSASTVTHSITEHNIIT